MRECEIGRLKHAEAGMNAAYRSLGAKLDSRGQAKLRAAQEAWLKFRTAEAEYQADAASKAASIITRTLSPSAPRWANS